MKKLFVVMVLIGAIFVSLTHFELFANTHVNKEQVKALLDEETVVISESQIYNLASMQEFYHNARRGIESEVYLIINPYTNQTYEYRLRFVDERILLFSSMGENPAHNYTVREYARLFRIYKNQEIHYVLECFNQEELILFGHKTN